MNLAALWSHERARVSAQLMDPAHGHSHSLSDAHDARTLKRQPSNSSLHGNTTTVSPMARKKVSVAVNRDSIFRSLLDGSTVPLADAVRAIHTQQIHDSNEFAIEFADRAPKRFVQQPQGTSATALAEASLAATEHGASTGKVPARRRSSALLPIAMMANAAAQAGVQPAVSPTSSRAKASPTMAPARRNPRKRGGNGTSLELSAHAFKPYVGDMFSTRGDYVDGMLYMSRMKRSHQLIFGHDAPSALEFGRGSLKDAVADALSAAVVAAAAGNLNLMASDGPALKTAATSSSHHAAAAAASVLSELPSEELLQLKQRQRCSLTLSNWSSNPANATLMVEENVVEALILLCKASEGDRVTKLNCVTTLMNLSHVDALRSELVQQGAVKTLVEIANEETPEDDKTLRTACAVTLCNLCCCLAGEEATVVEDGAVSALSLLINEHPRTASLCLCALFNLTCVKEPYHKIESVLKVFLTLASSSASAANVERDEIIAKAIGNLSNFKRVRLRLLEEGIVSAISNLIHAGHARQQQLLAYVLLNLSAMRACRSELVAKGCLGALVALIGSTPASDSDTKCLIALTLWNLSKEPANRLRMVFEGLLLLVHELCRGGNHEAVRAVCARTVYNVTCSEETRVKLVERDAVNELSSLSHKCEGEEGRKMCTLALCNLLSVQQAAAGIVRAGAIASLLGLSTAPLATLETRLLFATALHGLCELNTTRLAVVHAGVIPAILHLSATESGNAGGSRQIALVSEIRARCTAALACLAADEALASDVCTPAVVRGVAMVLAMERFNLAIERFGCACLSLLCKDEQCAAIVADEGALPAVLATCLESSDAETRAFCCHVLASMSGHRRCCQALVDRGVLSVLATLAKTSASGTTQRCCAITLANLSADDALRVGLIQAKIVPLLARLSNTYSEDSQRDCARVLCNLSSVAGYELALVRDGALGVLMMIAMVRALQPTTKETCVRAFANLLTHETVAALVDEGLVKVLPALAALPTASDVVPVLFGKLLGHDAGRHALAVERAALRALVALPPTQDAGDLYENLLCQIVYRDELRARSVDAGIVDALHELAQRSPSPSVASMLFALAKADDTRLAAASTPGLATLGQAVASSHVAFAISALCHLAWHEDSRARLSPQSITRSLTALLPTTAVHSIQSAALLALCCLSHSSEHLNAMLDSDVLSHLGACVHSHLPLVSVLFRQLSNTPAFARFLMRGVAQTSTVIRLFCLVAAAAVEAQDADAALDAADALCSITFVAPVSGQDASASGSGGGSPTKRPVAFVRRQSQPQLAIRGAMAVASSVPPATLVSSEVLASIQSLLALPVATAETRWRCTAALYAFSCISDYRPTLVKLGATRLLVDQASSSAGGSSSSSSSSSPAAVELATLRCCAGAMCNLTIVSGANADANAATMVEQQAVPALIRLATLESDEIREHCTLALSNLSAQSPKVEAGAVSALLSLSLHSGATASVPSAAPQGGVARPPPVVNARYRDTATLPDHALPLAPLDAILSAKYEAAQSQASLPPPPQLPAIAPDMVMVGGSKRRQSVAEGDRPATADDGTSPEDAVLRKRKSSSIGELLSASPATTPLTRSSSTADVTSTESELRGWPTMAFPKIDPAETRALSMNVEEEQAATPPCDAPAAQQGELQSSADAASHPVDEPGDSRSESEDAPPLRAKASKTGVSPLARVVIRKTQTSTAISKLKGLRGTVLASASASSLPLATVQEAHEHSHSVARPPVLHRFGTPKELASRSSSHRDVETAAAASEKPGQDAVDEGESVSVAAAAAAALLYSAAPSQQQQQKKKTKPKATAKPRGVKPAAAREPATLVATIEELPVRAKLLGLWG